MKYTVVQNITPNEFTVIVNNGGSALIVETTDFTTSMNAELLEILDEALVLIRDGHRDLAKRLTTPSLSNDENAALHTFRARNAPW